MTLTYVNVFHSSGSKCYKTHIFFNTYNSFSNFFYTIFLLVDAERFWKPFQLLSCSKENWALGTGTTHTREQSDKFKIVLVQMRTPAQWLIWPPCSGIPSFFKMSFRASHLKQYETLFEEVFGTVRYLLF